MSTEDHPDLVMLVQGSAEVAIQVLAAEFNRRNLLVIVEIQEILTLKSINQRQLKKTITDTFHLIMTKIDGTEYKIKYTCIY